MAGIWDRLMTAGRNALRAVRRLVARASKSGTYWYCIAEDWFAEVWLGVLASWRVLLRFGDRRAIVLFVVLWSIPAVPALQMILLGVFSLLRSEDYAENLRNLLWALSLVFGGYFAGIATINALRRTRLIQREQDAEIFAKAVEQLGSEQTAIRLGAIYAFEGLMRADFAGAGRDGSLGRQIGETLAAFVREQSAREEMEMAVAKRGVAASVAGTAPSGEVEVEPNDETTPRLAVDREAAVAVLARSWPERQRPDLKNQGGVDLSAARLSGLRLPDDANLRRFDFTRAHLERAQLRSTRLEGARLTEADLEGAHLQWARLDDADLGGANLGGAYLTDARLVRAFLGGANLEQAEFSSADLKWARLDMANLERAFLAGANLKGAYLGGANLEGTIIFHTYFVDEAGVMPAQGLTREMLAKARWYERGPPRLPADMPLPHRGDGKPEGDPAPFDESWQEKVGPYGRR